MSSAARKAIKENPEPASEDDPVWATLMRAPIGPPDTDEEREIIEAARARGEQIPGSASSAADAEWLNGFPGFAEEYIAKYPGAFELGARRATLSAMATRSAPLSHDPVLEALARAPIGEP